MKTKMLIMFHKINKGKGASIRSWYKAQGDIIIIQDADLEYDPALQKLINLLLMGELM